MLEIARQHGTEIQVNLFAGLIVFVLDVLLVALLLPFTSEFFSRRRWTKTHQYFTRTFLVEQQGIFERMASRARQFGDESRSVSSYTDTIWQASYAKLFKTTLGEISDLLDDVAREAPLYLVALGPDAHRAFINWRNALKEFWSEMRSAEAICWSWILTDNTVELRSANALPALRERMAALDEATRKWLATAGLNRVQMTPSGRVESTLPSDNFKGSWFDEIANGLLHVSNMSRLK